MFPFPSHGDYRRKNLFQGLTDLGLTTNLKVCLDAGDLASYGNQTDKWMDLSGNGQDFFKGSGTGADGADPTFNGITGNRSINDYFSSDGGDYFTYDTTNETWMQNLHKDGNVSTWLAWVYHPSGSGTSHGIGGTKDISVLANVGWGGYISSSNKLVDAWGRGGSTVAVTSTASVPTNQWNFLGLSHNENGGAGNSFHVINTTYETFDGNIASASASNAGYTMQIGATGNGARPFVNTARLAQIVFWGGTALSQTNVTNIYNATKGRFGL